MNTVYFYVYTANGLPSIWADRAISAIDNLESQINPSIVTNYKGNIDIDLQGSWNATLDHFENVLINRENETISDNEYHMLVINSATTHGAGRTEGAFGPHGNWADSPGVVGGANAATTYDSLCYGNAPVFKGTVVHEFIHGLMHKDGADVEGEFDEHSLGAIHTDTADNIVTPMQLWYTNEFCSGNSVPNDGNCSNNSNLMADYLTQNISSCTKNTINNYMSEI